MSGLILMLPTRPPALLSAAPQLHFPARASQWHQEGAGLLTPKPFVVYLCKQLTSACPSVSCLSLLCKLAPGSPLSKSGELLPSHLILFEQNIIRHPDCTDCLKGRGLHSLSKAQICAVIPNPNYCLHFVPGKLKITPPAAQVGTGGRALNEAHYNSSKSSHLHEPCKGTSLSLSFCSQKGKQRHKELR